MAKKLNVTPLHDRVIVQPAPAEERLLVALSFPTQLKKNLNVVLL
jgi:chaperonin GroES